MLNPPSFPITTVVVRPLPDAVIDLVGHDPRSGYVERYWLGVIGPSATWLLRRLAEGLEREPEGFEVDLPALAGELGLGARSGRNAPFIRTLERCERFGLVHLADELELQVRRKLPPLTRFQLERLPAHVRAAHAHEQERALAADRDPIERARGAALHHLVAGDDPVTAEQALHEAQVHPAVAHAAVAWAMEQPLVRQRLRAGDLPPEAA